MMPPRRPRPDQLARALCCVLALAMLTPLLGCASSAGDGGIGEASSADEFGHARIIVMKKRAGLQAEMNWTLFTYGHPDYEAFRIARLDVLGEANVETATPEELERQRLRRPDLGYDTAKMTAHLGGRHAAVEWDIADALLRQFQQLGLFRYGRAADSMAQAEDVFKNARTTTGYEKYRTALVVVYRGDITVLFPPVAEGTPLDEAHFSCFTKCTNANSAIWNAYAAQGMSAGLGSSGAGS